MVAYARPTRIEDAMELLARGGRTVLAGGTDFYPARVGRPLNDDVLDVSALAELRGIGEKADHWRIGAATTWTEVIEAKLPPFFDCLKLAAREIGGPQIQNAGTVAGNVCNASPAADGVPALLALDARIEIRSSTGTRVVPIQDFIAGPRKTVLGLNEIVTAISVPKPRYPAKSHFLKLGARKYLVISIAMVAAVIEKENGRVKSARVAVGACSPVARRLTDLERELVGTDTEGKRGFKIQPRHLSPLSPIDDVRGSAAYRMDAVLVLVQRALDRLA